MSMLTPGQQRVVRRETAVGTVANFVIGGCVFLLVFGTEGRVSLSGVSNFALDFIPQTFMTTLIGSLIPSLLAYRMVGRGQVAAIDGRRGLSLLSRAALLAASATLVLGGSAIAICVLAPVDDLGRATALAIKAFYSAGIAFLAAPSAVRAGL